MMYREPRTPFRSLGRKLGLVFIGFWIFSAYPVALAQSQRGLNLTPLTSRTTRPPFERQLEGPLQPLLREEIPTEGQPLEGVIDPETYLLGPGDLLSVNVMGEVDQEILARVAPDGTLRIATLGLFSVADRPFAEVRQEILTKAHGNYRISEIAVYLVQLRSFKTSISGMVWTPGTYTVTARDRVLELVIKAGGFYNATGFDTLTEPIAPQKNIAEPEQKPEIIPELPSYSVRRVQVAHRDRRVEQVDLLLFLRAGQPEGNPYLQDGDFLLIPPLNPQSGVLGIYGAVNYQGVVEYVAGDNLDKALRLAGGLTLEALRDSLEITRFTGSLTAYQTFFVNLNNPDALNTPLYPDDRVFVRARAPYHLRCQVEVRGQVPKPGFYPVAPEGTSLTEIIRLAGGFTELAGLREASLTRHATAQNMDTELLRLSSMDVQDMTPLELQYFKTRTQELKGLVAVDLHKLFVQGDASQDLLLRDQDVLEIPVATQTVKVTGQVKSPGFVAHAPGKPYSYYIQEAGGFSGSARRSEIRVIKAHSGQWIKPGKTTIEAGDTIFIPGKPYVDYWKYTKEMMTILTQFATIYLVIYNTAK